MKVKGKNGKEYFLVEVIAHILKYLKDELIKKMKRADWALNATDFDWVITVPAIWRARGKQMMREAGYKAGLCSNVSCGKLKEVSERQFIHMPEEENPDKLSLVLEPEAAAFYCQNISAIQRASHCNVKGSFKSDSYVVIDVGGGTVDIVAYQVCKFPEPHMEVLHEPTGGAWGGRRVNLEFKNFLQNLAGDIGFTQYINMASEKRCAKHCAELDEIVEENFEAQKTIFGDNDLNRDAKITVHLNFSFLKTYESELEKKIQDMHIQKIEHATIDDSDLRITYEKVQLFFDPIVDGIIECVAKVFSDVPDAYTVYLVGGFGGCQYIYNKLCARFGEKYKFITPEGRNHAVVKGAAMMKKTPQFLNARRVDATYGIETSIPFENGKHDELYRVPATVEGEPDMCSNIFTTFVEKGDVVSAQDVYMMSFTPERKDQRYMKVMIYTSLEKDVWYTTGKRPSSGESNGTYEDVNMIGELFVPFRAVESDESAEDQIVDVMFDFSGAEIKVTGFHRKSATEVRVVLNFLD
ncbi:Heat shock 70 kDa protein 12A [Geodia barretti]|nr:Heat shock 70 kDa protein 12A [Geodia barretti]